MAAPTALPWLLSGSADLTWAELSLWSFPCSTLRALCDNRSDFSMSAPSITSFTANWFLWGFKRFLQKAAPENNPCHGGSSQQSASGLNLIQRHTQCISNNFGGGKNPKNKKKYLCVLGHYITRRTNPWDWILNALAWTTPALCQHFQWFVTRHKNKHQAQ